MNLRKFQNLFFAVVVMAVVVLLFLRFSELSRIAKLFTTTHPGWFVAAVAAQVGTYAADTKAFADMLRTVGFRMGWWELLRASVVMEFLNDVAPSFGMSSNLYFVALMRGKGLPFGMSAVALMVQTLTSFVTYAAVLLAAAIYLIVTKEVGNLVSAVTITFVVLGSLFWAVILFIFAKERWTIAVSGFVSRVGRRLFRRWYPENALAKFVDEVLEGRRDAIRNWPRFFTLTVYKGSRFFFDALTAYFLFRAFDHPVSFGVVVVSYAVAMLLSTFSFLPGGLGSFEATMVLVFKSYNVPLETAGVVTLLFRGLTFWIPIPFGLWFFREFGRRDQALPDAEKMKQPLSG
ncbi:MAG: flippase-like domain-containing protein [Chloroflexi bacterium]|nr:flippase-like domain-containing protein [Chloroflexota bacterium]